MGKPRMIILIRHAQSEGNKNRAIHQTVPDHRVKLTPEGWRQAADAGRKLRSMLKPDDTLHFFTSPYRRTRETTEGILESLTSDDPEPSPFRRRAIKVYEEPRLREQDFGNFQPSTAAMEQMWQERAEYGHFFYRIPNGESAADAYDRISGFNESLWRQFGEDDCASVCILVTHGLMTRVFLMKWYHFSVEYFEDLRNVDHCEFVIMMQNPDNGKYILQNKLRTWSELRRERALAAGNSPTSTRRETYIPQWRWLRRASTSEPVDSLCIGKSCVAQSHSVQDQTDMSVRHRSSSFNHDAPVAGDSSTQAPPSAPSDTEDCKNKETIQGPEPTAEEKYVSTGSARPAIRQSATYHHNSEPKPSLSLRDRTYTYHSGRDFGGSMSGAASQASSREGEGLLEDDMIRAGGTKAGPEDMTAATSDDKNEQEEEEAMPHPQTIQRPQNEDEEEEEEVHGMVSGAQADALGDHQQSQDSPLSLRGGGGDCGWKAEDDSEDSQTHDDNDGTEDDSEKQNEALKKHEEWDRSIEGSVY